MKRRYAEGEVQEIVKRASEIEASTPTIGGSMTIGGIQQVAAEVGIDPALVRRAAGRLDRPTGGLTTTDLDTKPTPFSGSWWAGGPTRIAVERVILGELTESDCAYLVEEVRINVGAPGIVSTLGRSVSWVTQRSPGSTVRDVQVSITMRGGQTRIVIREGLGPMAGAIFGGVGGGFGGGGLGPIMAFSFGAMHSGVLAAILAPAWAITILSTARSIYHYRSRDRRRDVEALADRLASMASSLIEEATLPPGGSPGRIGAG